MNGLLHSDVLQSMNEESSLDALNQAFFYNEHSVAVQSRTWDKSTDVLDIQA